MTEQEDLVKKLPPPTRDVAKAIWETLSPADRKNLLTLFKGIPNESNLMRLLVKLSTDQVRMVFGHKHRVAIVGPANVGKSTLYNQFVQSKQDHTEVSPLPGTTRANRAADAGLFTIVDTPGADAVGYVGKQEQEQALNAAHESDFIVIVFDAIQGVKQTELDLYQHLVSLGKPYIVVLNKIDLVRKDFRRVADLAAANLHLDPEQVIPVVARTGENLDQVLLAIAATEPQMIAALGQALPQYRWRLAWQSIVSASSLAAVIALLPLPVIDFAPLIVTQSLMVLAIARIYAYKITPQRARELVITFGLGFLGRTIFQELSKLGGVPGWLLAAAIASSTTAVMGYAATVWFESGDRVSRESLNKMTQALTTYLLGTLKNLGKKKPSRETLREQIESALEKSPMAADPAKLDDQAK